MSSTPFSPTPCGMYIRQAKNDSRDSFIIAEVIRFGRFCFALLSEYTTPEELLAVNTDKLAETIYAASHGHHGLEKAQQIQDAAHNSFGILLACDSIALLIRQSIEQIRFVETQIDSIDAGIAHSFAAFDNQLTTITGIGPTLAAYAGVDPGANQSGMHEAKSTATSKSGSPELRKTLFLAMSALLQTMPANDPVFQFLDKKRDC